MQILNFNGFIVLEPCVKVYHRKGNDAGVGALSGAQLRRFNFDRRIQQTVAVGKPEGNGSAAGIRYRNSNILQRDLRVACVGVNLYVT